MSEARIAVSDECKNRWNERLAVDGAVQILERIAEACKSWLVSSFHHHAGTFCRDTWRNSAIVCLDGCMPCSVFASTGHYLFGGGDPVDAVRLYNSRIRHLHLKDVKLPVLDAARP